jgi:hypothetical protein
MELDLKNVKWGEFMFIDIFEIKNGFYNKKPNSSGKGNIPFIGATQYNNGVTEFYTFDEIKNNSKIGYGKNEPIKSKIFEGNCIAVTNNGSVGYAYYQTNHFTCTHDVNPLYLKNHTLNPYIAKFLISAIEMQKVCFEYARKWRPIRMVKSKILLPITPEGTPDYAFMEAYIREQEQAKNDNFLNYLHKRINEVKDFQETVPINEKEWGEFYLKDIFADIQRGKRLKKDDHQKGKVPYVSSTAMNNGVDSFVGNESKVRVFNNCLTIANSGSVGATFYQPFPFVASDHVTKLENKDFDSFIYLFIATITQRLGEKYSFNREINDNRIQKEKILLPITAEGTPDYVYMENYIKKIEFEKLAKYQLLKLGKEM